MVNWRREENCFISFNLLGGARCQWETHLPKTTAAKLIHKSPIEKLWHGWNTAYACILPTAADMHPHTWESLGHTSWRVSLATSCICLCLPSRSYQLMPWVHLLLCNEAVVICMVDPWFCNCPASKIKSQSVTTKAFPSLPRAFFLCQLLSCCGKPTAESVQQIEPQL